MRLLIIATVALRVATANAQPVAGPPSKTLERAIKLYDKKDWYSASVELEKVIQGETGDDAANKQRAEFFMGKTLFQMSYYAASLAMFHRMAIEPTHTYHRATIKWLIPIADLVPGSSPRSTLQGFEAADADDPMIDDKTRDAFHYYFARTLADRADPRAIGEFRAATGNARSRATLELAKLAFRAKQIDDAIAYIDLAARDPGLIDEAVRVLATWTRLLQVPPAARDTLKRLAAGNNLALLEYSRIGALARFPDFAGVSTETFDAVVIGTTCAQGPNSGNAIPALRATVDDLRGRITKLLAYDDNADTFEAVEKMIAHTPVLRLALLDSDTRDERAWTLELQHELVLVQRADRAWQTTQIAAEVLQELTVQYAVGQADVGKRYRNRLELIQRDLALLTRAFINNPASLALGPAAPPGQGITVMPALCSSQLGMPASAVATSPALPAAATPARTTGCAGCASGPQSGQFALLLLVAAVGSSMLRWGKLRTRRRVKDRTSTFRR